VHCSIHLSAPLSTVQYPHQRFTHRVLTGCGCTWLFADKDNEDSSSDYKSCSHRTWRTSVHEEVHLTISQLFKVVLNRIYARCINCFLRKTVLSIYVALREEVMTSFWLVLWLRLVRQLPAVSTSTVGNIWPTEELCPRNSWKALDHLKKFNQISPNCDVLQESSKGCMGLCTTPANFVFNIMRAPGCWVVF